MKKKIKAVLFDFDGTLIDTESQYTRFWEDAGRRLEIGIPDFAQLVKGMTLQSMFDKYMQNVEVQQRVARWLADYEMNMDYKFYPGAVDFLLHLKQRGILTAVVTSSNHAKMNAVKAHIPQLYEMVTCVMTAEDFRASKPAPDCYLQAAEALGAEIDECVVFEDAPNGLKAGMSAGMYTVGMNTAGLGDALPAMCNRVVDDFTHLTLDHLSRWVNG